MTSAIFELDTINDLPLWAQVLVASRACRRAALWLTPQTPDKVRGLLLDACDVIDGFAKAGQRSNKEIAVIKRATDHSAKRDTRQAFSAIYYAGDAAFAAESSTDFEAAEHACTQSVLKSLACVGEQNTLTPLQVRIFVAADLDLLRFACAESGVHRYDGLGESVFGRLASISPPRPEEIQPRLSADPTDPYR